MSSKMVLVLNCGSSSLKFAVINIFNSKSLIDGIAESLYLPEARITWKWNSTRSAASLSDGSSHREALDFIINKIFAKKREIFMQLSAIGHRVVHGGEHCTHPTIINDSVVKSIEAAIPFAPLHNPAHLIGIREAFKGFPHLSEKNVAVFDTAFHHTMPEVSYLYAIPYSFYKDHAIRRYGAHGTSHCYVSRQAAKCLNKSVETLNVITCHLGNGSSIAAIRNGQCIDTSMGFTPLEGLVMGTRSGDIDPSIIFHLHERLGLSMQQIKTMLTKESGLLGLTGVTSDFRYVEKNYFSNVKAQRAMDIYCHRLVKYIGAYSTLMDGRLDAVIFTGGIGENSSMVRAISLNKLALLGFEIDHARNSAIRYRRSGMITTDVSRPSFVIQTNEELVIAQEAARLTSP